VAGRGGAVVEPTLQKNERRNRLVELGPGERGPRNLPSCRDHRTRGGKGKDGRQSPKEKKRAKKKGRPWEYKASAGGGASRSQKREWENVRNKE